MSQTLRVHYPKSLTLLIFFLSFPVNGDYTQWGSWTECDVTCGGGHRQRSRACTSPVPEFGGLNCTHLGPTVQSDVCNTRPCAREYFEMGSCNCCQALDYDKRIENGLFSLTKFQRFNMKMLVTIKDFDIFCAWSVISCVK